MTKNSDKNFVRILKKKRYGNFDNAYRMHRMYYILLLKNISSGKDFKKFKI